MVILVFFTFYVSSGMVAAGKFFVSSFGWDYVLGMVLVAGITLVYTLFGGFLGATLTDVAQGLLMVAALVIVPIIAIVELGGWGAALGSATSVNPDAFNLFAGFGEKGAFWWTRHRLHGGLGAGLLRPAAHHRPLHGVAQRQGGRGGPPGQ